MKIHILPCHGCGKRRHISVYRFPMQDGTYYTVTCSDCGKQGPYRHDRKTAIKSWNASARHSATKTINRRRTSALLRRQA